MKTLTVRLPDALVAQIDTESKRRRVPKSDVVRERLLAGADRRPSRPAALDAIGDLVGAVDNLPADLSSRKKDYLTSSSYGRKRPR